MYSKLKLSELKNTNFKAKKIVFFIKLTKLLEVANFRFLTLQACHSRKIQDCENSQQPHSEGMY